jgi:hypothetical protein
MSTCPCKVAARLALSVIPFWNRIDPFFTLNVFCLFLLAKTSSSEGGGGEEAAAAATGGGWEAEDEFPSGVYF